MIVKNAFPILYNKNSKNTKNSVVIDDIITAKVIKYISDSESQIVCLKLAFIYFVSADVLLLCFLGLINSFFVWYKSKQGSTHSGFTHSLNQNVVSFLFLSE